MRCRKVWRNESLGWLGGGEGCEGVMIQMMLVLLGEVGG